MIHPLPKPAQNGCRTWVVCCSLVLFTVSPAFVLVQASPGGFQTDKEAKPGAGTAGLVQESQQTQQLEPGKRIERELIGDQPHSYQLAPAAGNYVKLVIDQNGIDVVVKLFGPDGKQITEVDSAGGKQGQETVSWVAEEAGSYRLSVLSKQKDAATGRYGIQVMELRRATENDRALYEAHKLKTEFLRLYRADKYDEARPLIERELEILERVWGPDHLDVAISLEYLARLYYFESDYARAQPLAQRVLTIREKALGPNHLDVATTLNFLASLHFYGGNYAQAEPAYLRALAIREKALEPEHLLVAQVVDNLASLYSAKGDYTRAEPLFQLSLVITTKSLGPDHLIIARTLNNLANMYDSRGDYEKAEEIYLRSLTMKEKLLGPEDTEVATTLYNLADNYTLRGEHAKAESLHRRALGIREKVLEPEHPEVADSLYGLADNYNDWGDYVKAEPLYARALAIREKVLGREHYRVGETVSGLANLYLRQGDYVKAEPLYLRALAVEERTLGLEHTQVAFTLQALAIVYAGKGDTARAVTFMSRANAVDERNYALNLTSGSERQKLAYLDIFSGRTDFTLWLHSQAAPNDPQALNLAFTTLLRRKARGLDAMTDAIATLRRHATSEDQILFDKLKDARSQLAALTLKGPGADEPDAYRKRLESLKEEVEKLEVDLSSRSAEFRQQAQPVTLAAVQAALPAGSALIEFSSFTPRWPYIKKSAPPRYLAYVLAAQGEPHWVDLGETEPIDRAVKAWRKALSDPSRIDVRQLGRVVDEKVMWPVRSLLGKLPGDSHHLLIAPDGPLNLIPFAALVDERKQYLVERYSISYLTSGRDLLRMETSQPSKSPPLVVANPDFGRLATTAMRSGQSSKKSRTRYQVQAQADRTQLTFQPLPATDDEALAIKALLPEATLLRRREEATETALKQARGPHILHIATHGFFLDYREPSPVENVPPGAVSPVTAPRSNSLPLSEPASGLRLSKFAFQVKEPLLRSGLALAGANLGKSGNDDGVLTALEAAYLDLSGTKLVVLSACNTGVGEVKNGEGVQGLRRALVLAGSESQVMSLWPVLDVAARDLMIAYYKALQNGEGRNEGLRQVQLEMLRGRRERRHPFYWAAFIQSGEWANLDGKR